MNFNLFGLYNLSETDKKAEHLYAQFEGKPIHVDYDIFGTVTGRLTTKRDSFPMLNLKREFKRFVTPKNDVFLELDFNAAEIRNAVFHDNPVHQMLLNLAGEEPGTTAQTMTQDTRDLRQRLGFSNRVDERNRFKVYNYLCRYFGYSVGSRGTTTAKSIVEFMKDYEDASASNVNELKKQIDDVTKRTTRLFGRYAFKKINSEKRGDITANIISANVLSDDEKNNITNQLKKSLGEKLSLNFDVDEDIIGGLIVKVGSKMIDTSIANKINKLKIAMKGA